MQWKKCNSALHLGPISTTAAAQSIHNPHNRNHNLPYLTFQFLRTPPFFVSIPDLTYSSARLRSSNIIVLPETLFPAILPSRRGDVPIRSGEAYDPPPPRIAIAGGSEVDLSGPAYECGCFVPPAVAERFGGLLGRPSWISLRRTQ